ncbi:MAG: TIGR01777 family oxidoreductase [Microbacteriaceae bacterium]
MRVLISGASGLIASELKVQLRKLGHEPISLVRREARSADEVSWNPATGTLDVAVLETIDAVVNLGGATTGKLPWTKKYKQELVASRLDSTRTLVEAIKAANNKPKVLISGSASGFYGDCNDAELDETAPKGTGFLSDLAAAWEKQALEAQGSTRVVLLRTTMVMSRKLGALGKLLPLLKLGIGGPLGSGKQWWAWISVVDEARAIIHLIENEQCSGAYNITAPEPATCEQIIRELAKGMKRPALFRVPAFAMRALLGEAADELLLCSQKMTADRLIDSGFKFEHPDLASACRYVLS